MRKFYQLFMLTGILFSLTLPVSAQVVINEYSCANWELTADNYNSYDDWIELYNTSGTPADISGYYLSDRTGEPTKWQVPSGTIIPAGGFILFWLSGRDEHTGIDYHTNFKLTQTRAVAEDIVFSDPSATVIDHLVVRKTQKHHSVGRTNDGAGTWSIFTAPTPRATNNAVASFSGYAEAPVASLTAGFYNGAQTLTLSTSEPNSEIRYTTNGNEPTASSTLYTGPINISSTTVLKAVTFSNVPGILRSFTEFNTYFINVNHTLIVLSIAADQLTALANGNASLRPQGSMEYFNKNKVRVSKAYGEFNEHGQDSWALDQRSLDWITRDEFGYDYAIREKIFPLTDRDEFQRFILRAAGDDNYPAAGHTANAGSAHMRDAYIQNLARSGGLKLDVRTAQKCIIYINGQYWGVYDMRERPDDHDYIEYNYDQDKFDIQYIKTWGSTWAEYGGTRAINDWNQLFSFIMSNDMSIPANYDYVTSQYDVESLVDYVIVNSITVCSDWLNYNTGWWRGLDSAGSHKKWGYTLWDNDATFDHYINYTGVPSTAADAPPCNAESGGLSDPEGHIDVLNRLLMNPGFRQFYVSRYIDLLNSTFSCQNMLNTLDSITALIDPEMAMHATRWFGTYTGWQNNVAQLRSFIAARCTLIEAGMINCYNLDGPYEVMFDGLPHGTGKVKINSLVVQDFPFTGSYYGGIDVLLKALPDTLNGFVFDSWQTLHHPVLPGSTLPNVIMQFTGTDTVIARFKQILTEIPEEQKDIATASVFPTIASTEATVEYYLPEAATVSIRLVSLTGQEVLRMDVPKSAGQGTFQVKLELSDINLSAGMYMVDVRSDAFRKSLPLICQQQN